MVKSFVFHGLFNTLGEKYEYRYFFSEDSFLKPLILMRGLYIVPIGPKLGWMLCISCFIYKYSKLSAIPPLLGLRCALWVAPPAGALEPPAATSSITSMASSAAEAPPSNSGDRPCTKLSLGPSAFKVEHGGRCGKPEIRQQEIFPAQHTPIRSKFPLDTLARPSDACCIYFRYCFNKPVGPGTHENRSNIQVHHVCRLFKGLSWCCSFSSLAQEGTERLHT